jgi:hypothetical protein
MQMLGGPRSEIARVPYTHASGMEAASDGPRQSVPGAVGAATEFTDDQIPF